MGGFVSNRDQIESGIQQGGWAPPTGAVAFGGELQVKDIANGLVAAGVSFYLDDPAPFLDWLEALTTNAISQMEQSIVASFTPVAKQQAIDFAKGVISTLLQGRNPGEQFIDVFHFNFKAGVAQFNGQNTQWVPNVSVESIGNLITSGDTGGHEEPYGPFIPWWCACVGFRYNPSVGSQPPASSQGSGGAPKIGQIEVINSLGAPVDVKLYHPQNPNVVFANWHIAVGQTTFLALNNNRITIGSDWRIQVVFADGNSSAIYYVGAKASFIQNSFVFNVNSTPSLSIGQIRITNDYNQAVDIRLYHPQNPGAIFANWHILSNMSTFLELANQTRVTIGSDWGIQILFANGVMSQIRKVATIGLLDIEGFEVTASRVENG